MNRRTLVALILTAFVAGLLLYGFSRKFHVAETNRPKEQKTASTVRPAGPVAEHEIERSLQTLVKERNIADETVWAQELLAERHEQVFIRLWDSLRLEGNTLSVLQNFRFGQLLLGHLGEPTNVASGIHLRRMSAPLERLELPMWREQLERLQQAGIQLEQSEWRQARFSSGTNGGESVISLTLHALNPRGHERFVVRGDLRVTWSKPRHPNDEPFPELIDASNLTLLSRRGEPSFHHVVAADVTPEGNERFSEPSLQLYDLNGDGLSEIILAGRNRVFWNRGNGVFAGDRLFAFPLASLQAGLIADFDGDGLADCLAADSSGLALFAGNTAGRFLAPSRRIRITPESLPNPIVMTAGDIDHDGDLDVWLAQYKVPYRDGQMPAPYYDANDGYPSFLLLNDGKGNFIDHTQSAGLAAKRFRRSYSSSFVDLDNDGDLDLVVVSDFAGADIYLNDGKGQFTDRTTDLLDEPHTFGMAHCFQDFDLDGQLDFLVIGMNSYAANRLDAFGAGPAGFARHNRMRAIMAHGNRLYLRRGSRFSQTSMSDDLARSGWSWGAATGDFDNDGDPDVYVVNGHISGQSTKDYESQFWRHDIYVGDSRTNAAVDRYFQSVRARSQAAGHSYGGFEKNRFFLNQAGQAFLESGYLMGLSMEEDGRNAVADDLDADGKLDLLVVTLQMSPAPRQYLHLFPNFTPDAGSWIGIRLRETKPGFSPVGAKVSVTTRKRTQVRQFVVGDSYRSQHSPTAHFGLGTETEIEKVEVVWPNGRRQTLLKPAINRYHSIAPDPVN